MKHNEDLGFHIINNDFPYEILLLADETIDAINKYLFNSTVYAVIESGETIAVFCLLEIDKSSIEIKNIAVVKKHQNKGIGSEIIDFIKTVCKDKYSTIIVGTSDCGMNQIAFYERNGFEKFKLRKKFFLKNYPEPIYENGVQLKDMILLKYEW